MEDALTVNEVAKLQGITPAQVIRNIKRKKYPSAYKRGWVWFIPKKDLK